MMAATKNTDKFWDRIANRYAKQPIADQPAYEKKLELTRTYFNAESRVLEFGCGTGSTALLHAPYVKHILATDISARMIEIAQDKAKDAKVENVSFQRATLEELPIQPEGYDVILGLNILHLLEDYEGAIKRSYELLKPDGVFISSSGCLTRLNWFLRNLLPVIGRFGLIPKVQFFDLAQLESSMLRAGFQIERCENYNKNGLSAFIVARKPR